MNPTRLFFHALSWLALFAVLSGPVAWAAGLDEEILQTQQKIEQLDKQEATPANKQLKEVYQQILSIQQEQAGYLEKTNRLNQQLKEHASRSTELKRSLQEQSAHPPTTPSFADKPLHELERLQEAAATEKLNLQNQLDETQNRLAQLQARLVPAQNELSDAKRNLEQVGQDNNTAPGLPLEGSLASALQLKKRKTYEARNAQIQYLGLELLSIPEQVELAGLNKEWLTQKLKNLAQYQEKLQGQLQQLRMEESTTILDESLKLRDATNEDPALQWLADENVALGNQLTALAGQSQSVTNRLASIEQLTKLIEQRYTLLKQELELGGDTEGIGELMRQMLVQLQSLGEENTSKTIGEIQKIQIQSLNYERKKSELLDKSGFAQSVAARFPRSQLSIVDSEMRDRLNSLLDLRGNLIGKLLDRNQQSLKNLSLLLNAQNQFNDQIWQFDKLLMENLLWTETNPVMGFDWLLELAGDVRQVLKLEWQDRLTGIPIASTRAMLALALAYAVLLYILKTQVRPRFQAWQTAANAAVGNVRRDAFRNTPLMLAGEFLFSLPAPLFLLGLRKTIQHVGAGEAWARPFAEGLLLAAFASLILGLLHRLVKPDSVLAGQLRWPDAMLKAIFRELRWRWLLVLLPAYIFAVEMQSNDVFRYEFGRLPFLALCALLAIIFRRLARIWRSLAGGRPASPWNAVGSPPLLGRLLVLSQVWLAGMEVFGFHLGALTLQGHLLKTLLWIFGIVLAHHILRRWLLLEQHRMAYARAQAIRAERRATSEDDGSDEASLEDKRRQFIEIETISLQSQALLNLISGTAFLIMLGWVWSDLVPAFHLLDQVALWEIATSGSGGASIETITLKSVMLALAVAGLATLASRNLPSMVQLLVLQHLKLAPGSDFAITTILKYGIFAAGLVTICQLLGLQWDDLQWLVAALGVGLGFGLQEIFANFICGLIILFEKPIRIGDIVTLGNGVTGTIDAINTRATTLTDWDNKEIIIPNKTLITEQLTNWSLSSHIIRLIVPVGIAYGSDTNLAHRLLLRAAQEHPLVLDRPEVAVLFRAFGASSLDFELRCFVAEPGVRLGVIHDLNMRIDKLFREHGVEIAFPQMDVHIKGDAPTTGT